MRLRTIMRRGFADLEGLREKFLGRQLRKGRTERARSGHVLIVGPGNGSIGDEAMYEAFVQNCPGTVTVIAREPADVLWRDESGRVDYIYMRNLVYGRPTRRAAELRQLLRIASASESVSLVGADIMDGVYDDLASVRRFRTAALAADAGAEARILGFSWNSHPTLRSRRAMVATGARVRLFARDEASAGRLQNDGGTRVDTVADLAFLTKRDAPLEDPALKGWLEAERAGGRRIVIVNANPRQESRFAGLRDQYITLIRELRRDGDSVVLLPHDSRGGSRSEEAYVADLANEVGTEHVYHVENAPLPEQVVAIAREGTLVVSGRMHLVVLASVAGRSTVALEYQDKFAGLYRLLGYDGRVKRSDDGTWDLSEAVRTGLEDAPDAERRLEAAWSEVVARASRNLDGLRFS